MKIKLFFVLFVLILARVVSSCNKEVLQLDNSNTIVGNTTTNTFNIVPTDWTLELNSDDSVGFYYPIFMANMNPAMPYGTFLYGIKTSKYVIDSITKDTIYTYLNVDTLNVYLKLFSGNFTQLDSNYNTVLNNVKYSFNYRGYDSTIFLHALKTGITDTSAKRVKLTDSLTAQLIFKQVPSKDVTVPYNK